MGLGGNFLTQKLILERLDRAEFIPVVVSPVEGIALHEFRKMGVECIVISPPGKLDRYGGAVIRSGLVDRSKTALDLIRYNLHLARFLRLRHIDVVYANCVRAEMCIGLACRLVGVPSLLYIKGELANPVIDILSFVLSERILFFCEQNRDDKYRAFVRSFPARFGVLKIGLDELAISSVVERDKSFLRNELGIQVENINVGIIGQLYRPKGQHLVLEALAMLVNKFPNLQVYLLGDHVLDEYRPYKQELDRMVQKNGLENHVKFTGWRKDALDIVSLMDIVIHPSLAEGFGRAVLEAMAFGKPVIASKVGGLREAIKDGVNGFFVEPGDVKGIADRWRRLIVDAELRMRMGRIAKETVFSEYLIDDKVAKLANLWKEIARAAA